MEECVFCKIKNHELPAKLVYESDNVMAFADIHPKAEVHIIIAPKEHIKSIRDIKGQGKLLEEVYEAVDRIVKEQKLDNEHYRVVVNGGKSQIVPHIHFHLLGKKWYKFV